MRRWLHRFNAAGLDGLGSQPGAGRKRRITEAQRSAIIGMARSLPPGRLDRDGAGELSADDRRGQAQWTLDTLAEAARNAGIRVGRSQVRRILLAEKVRWRRTRSWATSTDPEFVPKVTGALRGRRDGVKISRAAGWLRAGVAAALRRGPAGLCGFAARGAGAGGGCGGAAVR